MQDLDKTFDSDFQSCVTTLRYYPWVGKNYAQQKCGILIVGESHYYGEDCTSNDTNAIDSNHNFTRECFKNEDIQVYQKMEAILANNLLDYDWIGDNISFYNFFQKCVGYGASDKSFITKQLIKESRKAFFEVLRILTPDIAIIWGVSDMWNWMPPFEEEGDKMYTKEIYAYSKYDKTKIFHISHPSSRTFDIIKTANFIKDQFSVIRNLSGNNAIIFPLKKTEEISLSEN